MRRELAWWSDLKKAKTLVDAALSGNLQVVKEVAKEWGESQVIRIKNQVGLSALHLAASHGRTQICQYFVEDLGFPVDILAPQGETPLSHAARRGHIATARYLISQGANPVAPNMEGWTPLHCAAGDGQDEIVKYLLSLGVPVDVTCSHATGAPLIWAARFGHASIVEILLQHHADVNSTTSIDYTPLLSSICADSLECTKLVIKAGADLNLKCPLDSAIHCGSVDIIKCLLEAGADPNVRNKYEWLPIERAVIYAKWDIAEMLFPLTSPVPEVHDWSVHGILQYVESDAFKEKCEAIQKKDLADLKVKGADSVKKKEYLNALDFYSKAITIDSRDAALFSNVSLCAYQLGYGEMALSDALMAQRLRPGWPKAYYRVGAAHMLLREYEKASQAFMDGSLLDPTNIEMKEAYWEAENRLRTSHVGETSE
ncbi:ankyrin repeat family protein [Rhynchospora pubera]|uniref:Ankyrin repeat family protein n=1 Tax=Rhynchospora pubera TaxID=906938 RepID=A0AAV8HWI0_9POAL|nr:ankyrin repeat family protein [Rhynchospora pubera]